MSRAVEVHEEAELELQLAALWYEGRQPGIGAEFLQAVERAVDNIARGFDGAPCARGEPTVRCVAVPRFPYCVVFVLEGEAVLVLAFAHRRRRPAYWRARRPP